MAKKKEPGYQVPLFDRIFKPEVITLPNGHTVSRPRSRMPLIIGVLVVVIWTHTHKQRQQRTGEIPTDLLRCRIAQQQF